MKKRMISWLLVLCMVLSMGIVTVSADDAEAVWGTSANELTESGTLKEAIAAASKETTYVQLQKNVTSDAKYNVDASGGDLTLDLNGYTVSIGNSIGFDIRGKTANTLTFTDTYAGTDRSGCVEVTATGHSPIFVRSNCALNVVFNGGTYQGPTYAMYVYDSTITGTITVNEGTFITLDNAKERAAAYLGGAELILNGGTFVATAAHQIQFAKNTDARLTVRGATEPADLGFYIATPLNTKNFTLPDGYAIVDKSDAAITGAALTEAPAVYTIKKTGTAPAVTTAATTEAAPAVTTAATTAATTEATTAATTAATTEATTAATTAATTEATTAATTAATTEATTAATTEAATAATTAATEAATAAATEPATEAAAETTPAPAADGPSTTFIIIFAIAVIAIAAAVFVLFRKKK